MKPILILYLSSGDEHLASAASATRVERSLIALGYDVTKQGITTPVDATLIQKLSKNTFVFNCMHGTYGEDGRLQGLLDMSHIRYTGSSLAASSRCFHKDLAKESMRYHALPTPRYLVPPPSIATARSSAWDQLIKESGFDYPLVVKPVASGSSLGIRVVNQPEELPSAQQAAQTYSECVMIEEFIPGREVSVGILDDRVLGAMEIRHDRDIFNPHGTNTAYPSSTSTTYTPLSTHSLEILDLILNIAKRCYQALRCAGACRVDMIISDANQPYILEIDTVPGLGPDSLLPKLAKQNGISFNDLIKAMIAAAQ